MAIVAEMDTSERKSRPMHNCNSRPQSQTPATSLGFSRRSRSLPARCRPFSSAIAGDPRRRSLLVRRSDSSAESSPSYITVSKYSSHLASHPVNLT